MRVIESAYAFPVGIQAQLKAVWPGAQQQQLKQRGYDGEKDERRWSQPLWRSGGEGGGGQRGRTAAEKPVLRVEYKRKETFTHDQ